MPHTKTGKRLEVPVKRILQGADLSAVADPAALDDAAALEQFVEIGRRLDKHRLQLVQPIS